MDDRIAYLIKGEIIQLIQPVSGQKITVINHLPPMTLYEIRVKQRQTNEALNKLEEDTICISDLISQAARKGDDKQKLIDQLNKNVTEETRLKQYQGQLDEAEKVAIETVSNADPSNKVFLWAFIVMVVGLIVFGLFASVHWTWITVLPAAIISLVAAFILFITAIPDKQESL